MKGEGTSRAEVRQWLAEARVPPKVQQNIDRLADSDDVQRVVVLPDVHLGRLVNNGCVAATVDLVYPQAGGSDIGCGFSAVRFNTSADVLKEDERARTVIRQLHGLVPALKQSSVQAVPASLRDRSLSDPALAKESERDGAWQFGTLGSGNHFVEFQEEEAGALWLMVHSGSRALGQLITRFHLERATRSRTGLLFLDGRSALGQAYLNDMDWAVCYASLNRLAIMARVVEFFDAAFGITAEESSYLDSPHNFARRERHFGRELIVHRKSANSAGLNERNLIAGSMGSPSFIVEGLGLEESLCSSSHGAGRVMSRTEACQRISPRDLKRQLGAVKYDDRQLARLCDEAPGAYRDIRKVMQAQHDLVRRRARLNPVLNFKFPDTRRT
ncbi:MAG: RtcB family protein [Verrucomicrobiales bacterium]|nr:RtcB family protein [Verrucomicrobiales bacterium]